uniref:F-box domain-containing protein n=1 Tax=Amphimedon queenslandica TaxID=400682 RepID=A0A1X7SSA7_AMPQE
MDSLPVPLLIQCLLYLIGNLFDDDDKPIPGLALLPRSIRIKLLLLLPAIDVHKLEGTSVTADILMDEIWETLYKERTCNNDCWSLEGQSLKGQSLDEFISLFSWKDLYFSYMFTCDHATFYEANKELSVYFTHVKEAVYDDIKTATFHNVVWWGCFDRVTTKKYQSEVFKQCNSLDSRNRFLDLAVTMTDLHIPLKIVTNNTLYSCYVLKSFNRDIAVKLLASVEVFHHILILNDNAKELYEIIFIENGRHIKSCTFLHLCQYEALLLDYLQQQCDLKILDVGLLNSQYAKKFQEVVKCHKNLEVVSIGLSIRSEAYDHDFIQCLSELMYRPCFKQLHIKDYSCIVTSGTPSASFNGVRSLLSAFFLSPYPVTLRLHGVCLTLDSTDPIPVPLAINTEQQLKSLDVRLYASWHGFSHILECNSLPQYIVLKSLKIRSSDALCLFSKVKSIKVDEITVNININTNTNSLRSLINIVSTNDMKIVIYYDYNLHQFTLSLETIFNSLPPTKPPYLQLIVMYSGDDPSPILYDTWKKCGAIKLKKAAMSDWRNSQEIKNLEEMM